MCNKDTILYSLYAYYIFDESDCTVNKGELGEESTAHSRVLRLVKCLYNSILNRTFDR